MTYHVDCPYCADETCADWAKCGSEMDEPEREGGLMPDTRGKASGVREWGHKNGPPRLAPETAPIAPTRPEDRPMTIPENTPPSHYLRAVPSPEPPDPRVQLALSILAHRPWCGDCVWHVQEAQTALLGDSIDDILGGRC